MKKILISFIFGLIAFTGYSQLNCSKYYPLKEGVKYEIKSYNKKDKLTSSVKYHIKSVSGDKATIATTVFDKKGKEVMTSEYDVTCNGDGISVDFKSLMSADVFKQYKGMDIDITGTNLELPNKLKVGETLPDANMHADINTGIMKLKMDINLVDRKVEGKETITTQAGKFECFVLSHDTELKMGIKQEGKSKQWLAEGVGLVRSEEYNSKGKLLSYSVLTSMN